MEPLPYTLEPCPVLLAAATRLYEHHLLKYISTWDGQTDLYESFVEEVKAHEVTRATQVARAFGAILLVRNKLIPEGNGVATLSFVVFNNAEIEWSARGLDELISKGRDARRIITVEMGEMDLEGEDVTRSLYIPNMRSTVRLFETCEAMALALRPCLRTADKLHQVGTLLADAFTQSSTPFAESIKYLRQLATLQVT